MLDNKIIKKIEDFVFAKPRSIQEIATHLNKNWRTVDRYIEKIMKDFGTIDVRIFREGTRGALKIVYGASVEKISHSVFQEEMEKQIMNGKTKWAFSPFDVYQHVNDSKKTVVTKKGMDENGIGRLKPFKEELEKNAKKQLLFFSGNLSFVNFSDSKIKLFDVLEELIKKGVTIKVISRIDLTGIDNVKKLLSLNYKYGKEVVDIRHREQPLRVTIMDNKLINMKEIKVPTGRSGELDEKQVIFYSIKDTEWVEWMTKIFWKMFNSSVGYQKRLLELEKIR